MKRLIPIFIVASLLLSACSLPFTIQFVQASDGPAEEQALVNPPKPTPTEVEEKPQGSSEEPEDLTVEPTPTPIPTPINSGVLNPLTGLPLDDPECLNNPPAVISITNFPASARPQAGLDFSNVVVEAYIGEGMTRFLAIFYCDYPENPEEISQQPGASDPNSAFAGQIGPIRSGRIWYEDIRKLFNGFIVMASAWSGVSSQLSQYSNVFGSDDDNVNSAMVDVTKLDEISKATAKKLGIFQLTGNVYDQTPPEGGVPAESLWTRYSLLNQVMWRYDPESGAYNRYNNDTKEGTSFEVATDRLNGNPLTYENVIVMFADHHAKADTLVDIDYLSMKRPALLFRDGRMYQIDWTTVNGDYERSTGKLRPPRFVDKSGNPVALKPGQTWLMVVPTYTPYYETLDSWNIIQMLNTKQPGSGHWAVVFYTPKIEK
jgi:hypothetical protein